MNPEVVAQLVLTAGQLLGQALTVAQQVRDTASIEDQQKLDAAITASLAAANVSLGQAETDLGKAAGV